ncbi:MAG: hypothetical protein ACYDC8_15450 [Gammaproteobacteria bacterium]
MADVANLDTHRARRHSEAELARIGWSLDVFETTADGPTVYLVDADTGYRQLVTVIQASLDDIRARMLATPKDRTVSIDAFAQCFAEQVARKRPSRVQIEQLALWAAVYVAGTRTYLQLRDVCAHGGTFLVLRYRDAETGQYLLRPAASNRQTLMSPDEVYAMAEQVLAADRILHPARFPRADVIAIPRRQPAAAIDPAPETP